MRPAKGENRGVQPIFFPIFFSLINQGFGASAAGAGQLFYPSVKLPLALSKGLCHKQPIETKQTKEIILMLHSTALSVAEHAIHTLQGNEGRMSEEEKMVAVYALSHALKAIAKHNCLEDLDAPPTRRKKRAPD